MSKSLEVGDEGSSRYCLHTMIEGRPPGLFSRQLTDDVKLSIVGRVGHWGSQTVACVSREFREMVKNARELRMYGGHGLSVSACTYHTAINVWGRVYTLMLGDHVVPFARATG